MKTVFCDLDGTLTDVYDRYVSILNDYIAEEGLCSISREEYIAGKWTGQREHEIVYNLVGREINVERYTAFKQRELEAEERLRMDFLLCDPTQIQKTLCEKGYRLVLVTMRKNKDNCMRQLEWLGIKGAFDDIFIVQKGDSMDHGESGNPKADAIKECHGPGDIVIGDSHIDMECAQILGIRGCFVRTGLENLVGDNVFEDVDAAIEWVKEGAKIGANATIV